MSNHLLEYIEIKDFKCFKDFKAEGFKRVNLIGGKNNVGKTAFMEACYVNTYSYKSENTISMAISDIIMIRYNQTFFQDLFLGKGIEYVGNRIINIKEFDSNEIYSNIQNIICSFEKEDLGVRDKKNRIKSFVGSSKISDDKLESSYGFIIENGLEDKIDKIIKLVDSNIKSFRIINSEPKCNFLNNPKFINIHELGDGLLRYISIIFSLFICQKSFLFIDEIENGIHYSKLDKLWEIILTISKEQTVQVFATTHSKECIESYARVSKKLEEEQKIDKDDVCFIELGRNDNVLESITYNYEEVISQITDHQDLRGW